jgi:hypothetical protein
MESSLVQKKRAHITSPASLHHLSITENMITGISHVNLIVPPGTLHLADAFYGETLGMHRAPVPPRQKDMLAW